MHVPMCGPHKHTQTNVQYGAFEEWSLLTEPQHQPVKKKNTSPPPERKSVHVQRALLKEGEALTQHTGDGSPSEPSRKQDGEAFNLS